MPGTENVIIRCLTCGEEGEATTSVYNRMISQAKHKDHKIRFVEEETGEVLAGSISQAQKKGILDKKDLVTESGGMLFSDQGEALIPMEVLMPASALASYFKLKQNGLSSHKSVMGCVWYYAQVGIMKETGLALTLAPVEAAPQVGVSDLKASIAELKGLRDSIINSASELSQALGAQKAELATRAGATAGEAAAETGAEETAGGDGKKKK